MPLAEVRMAHLDLANRVRVKRKVMKQHLRAGTLDLADVLRADKWFIQTMSIRQLLLAVPGLGPVKTKTILTAHRVSPSTRLENVCPRRREEILAFAAARFPTLDLGSAG